MGFQIFPVLAALISVPMTISLFGSELFALFSLSVSVIVLFNYLNFGIAQSVNREIAKLEKNSSKTSELIFSGFIAITLISLLIVLLGAISRDSLIYALVQPDTDVFGQAKKMLNAVIYSAPIFLYVILLRNILEARQKFKTTAINRAVLNSVIFMSPLACYVTDQPIYFAIYISIITHFISLFILTRKVHSEFSLSFPRVKLDIIKSMFTSGGLLTVISITSVFLLYTDKFIIGAYLGLLPVAYYVAAYDLISRASLVYGSLSSAYFPAFSFWYEKNALNELKSSLSSLYSLISAVMLVVCLGCIIFSNLILELWINKDYAENASHILSFLSIGIFLQALAVVPLRLLTATGFEKIVATFYVTLSFVYVMTNIYLASNYDILAIAVSFTLKAFIELVVLHSFICLKVIKSKVNLHFQYKILFLLLLIFFIESYLETLEYYLVIAVSLSLLFLSSKDELGNYINIRALIKKGV